MGGMINIIGSKMSSKTFIHLDTALCSCVGDRCHKIPRAHEKANGIFRGQNGMGEDKMIFHNSLDNVSPFRYICILSFVVMRLEN